MFRWRQSALRPCVARRRWRRAGRVAVEPARDVVVVELLAPEQAGERLALDAALVVGHRAGRRARRRTRPPRRARWPRSASASANGVARARPPCSRSRMRLACRRAGSIEPVVTRPPWCRLPSGLTASGPTVHDRRVERVLDVRRAVRRPRRAARLFVSFSVKSSRGAPSRTAECRSVARGDGDRARPSTASPRRSATARRHASGRAARRSPMTRCCGTRASAGGGAAPRRGRDW